MVRPDWKPALFHLLYSFSCVVLGIVVIRKLPSLRNRIAIILSAPLITYYVRLTIFTLQIGVLVTSYRRWWGLSAQGVMMFLLYLSGGVPHRVDVQVDDPAQQPAAVHRGAFTLHLNWFSYSKTVLVTMWGAAKMFLNKDELSFWLCQWCCGRFFNLLLRTLRPRSCPRTTSPHTW